MTNENETEMNEEIKKPECFGQYCDDCENDGSDSYHACNNCNFDFNIECKEATDCQGKHLSKDEIMICENCGQEMSCAVWYGTQIPISCSLNLAKKMAEEARQQGKKDGIKLVQGAECKPDKCIIAKDIAKAERERIIEITKDCMKYKPCLKCGTKTPFMIDDCEGNWISLNDLIRQLRKEKGEGK